MPDVIFAWIILEMFVFFFLAVLMCVVPGLMAWLIYSATGESFNTTVLVGLFVLIGTVIFVIQ